MKDEMPAIMPEPGLCPCGQTSGLDLKRVHRGRLVKIFFGWLPLKRYKCYKCMRTRYQLKKKQAN